jgi:hypothetical protein
LFRWGLTLGALVAVGLAVAKLLRQRADDELAMSAPATTAPRRDAWPPLVQPDKPAVAAWVEPVDGVCPTTHPVKAKLKSKIFHVAGGGNYDRTIPERCYRDPAAAEADGFRQSKT